MVGASSGTPGPAIISKTSRLEAHQPDIHIDDYQLRVLDFKSARDGQRMAIEARLHLTAHAPRQDAARFENAGSCVVA